MQEVTDSSHCSARERNTGDEVNKCKQSPLELQVNRVNTEVIAEHQDDKVRGRFG